MDINLFLTHRFEDHIVYINDPLLDLTNKLETIYAYRVVDNNSDKELSNLKYNLTNIKDRLEKYKSAHRIYWFFVNFIFGYDKLLTKYDSYCVEITERQNALLRATPPTPPAATPVVVERIVEKEHHADQSLRILLEHKEGDIRLLKLKISELESANQRLDGSSDQTDHLRKALEQRERELKDLQGRYADLERRAHQTEELQRKISLLESQIQQQGNNAGNTQELEITLEQNEKLIKQLRGELSKCRSEAVPDKKRIAVLEKSIERKTANIMGIRESLQDQKLITKQREEDIAALLEEIAELNRDIKKLTAKSGKQARDYQELAAELEQLKAVNDELESENHELTISKRDHDYVSNENARLIARNMQLQSMVSPLQSFAERVSEKVGEHGALTVHDFQIIVGDYTQGSQDCILSEE